MSLQKKDAIMRHFPKKNCHYFHSNIHENYQRAKNYEISERVNNAISVISKECINKLAKRE